MSEPIETPVVPTPAPTPTATPVTSPPAPEPEVGIVRVSLAEWKKTQDGLTELNRRLAAEEQKARDAEERAIKNDIENGRTKELMSRLDQKTQADAERLQREYDARAAEIERKARAEADALSSRLAAAENARQAKEQRAQRYALDGEVSRALAAHNLVPGGAEQLSHLWRSQFTVADEGESFAVRATSGQAPAEFVAAQLARPEYAHFVRSGTHHGGTIVPGLNPGAGSPGNPETPPRDQPTQFKTYGDWAVAAGKNMAPGAIEGGFAAAGLRAAR